MNCKQILLFFVFVFLFSSSFSQRQDSLRKVDIEEVIVTAYRARKSFSDLPHKVEVVGLHEIRQTPSENATDLLKKTSSVDVIQYPSLKGQVGMRGFSPSAHSTSYTVMMVNGLPAGTENVSTIGVENAEQVEIMKGPFSSFFGSGAMAGVVNFVTPRREGPVGGSAGFEYGSFENSKIHANVGGSLGNGWNFDFSANYGGQRKNYRTGSNNLLDLDEQETNILGHDTHNEQFENTTYKKAGSYLRVGYKLDSNWEIHSYTNMFMADDVYSHGTFWGVYGDGQKDITRWSQSIHVEGETANHSFKIAPYYSNQQMEYYNEISDDNFVDTKKSYEQYGFIVQDAFKWKEHKLIAGVDNHSRKYSAQRWDEPDNQVAPYNPDYLNMTTGIFIQTDFSFFNESLDITASGRFDYIFLKLYDTEYMDHQTGEEQHYSFNPKIGVQYELLSNFEVHSSYGTAFLAPDAFQKAGNYSYSTAYGTSVFRGNPDIKPETSRSIDAGIGYKNRNAGLSTDVTFFSSRHHDMIVYDRSNPDYITFKNSSKARMKGVEVLFSYDLGALSNYDYSLKLYANVTHLFESEVKEVGEEYEKMHYVRKNNGNFGLEFRSFNGLDMRLNSRFIGSRYENNWLGYYDVRTGLEDAQVLKHPQFVVVDFSGSYTFKEKYKIGVKVNNLLDEIYTEKDGYFMPGRMIKGSVSYKF